MMSRYMNLYFTKILIHRYWNLEAAKQQTVGSSLHMMEKHETRKQSRNDDLRWELYCFCSFPEGALSSLGKKAKVPGVHRKGRVGVVRVDMGEGYSSLWDRHLHLCLPHPHWENDIPKMEI